MSEFDDLVRSLVVERFALPPPAAVVHDDTQADTWDTPTGAAAVPPDRRHPDTRPVQR
jgi:hypothetical protein